MAAASLFLLHFFFIISLSRASVNIDCGTSSGSGVDSNNITWIGDTDFITDGESAIVASRPSTTIEESLTTLPYFPTGDSNCYSNIPVIKGGKVLVRTMFYYGNYDGKSSYPSFLVVIDGKHRHAVTLSSMTEPDGLELIFTSDGEKISVCFVRTSSTSNPFVSSIEVVDLAAGMYDELGTAEGLFYQLRIAYGSTQFIRSDDYGRFWYPSGPSPWNSGLTSTATTIDTSDASNKPPESILRNSWTGEGLTIGGGQSFPFAGVPIYLAMYFSNPIPSDLRTFNIFFNDRQVNKDPVVPVFGKVTQLIVRDLANSSSMLVFRPTGNTISPPMINALELYVISKSTTGGPGQGGGGGPGGGDGGGPGTIGAPEGDSGKGKSNNLSLPLGIGLPVCVVISFCYGIWRIIIKPKQDNRAQTIVNQQMTIVNHQTFACCCQWWTHTSEKR